MLGGGSYLAMDYHPIRGGNNIPSRFMLQKPELSASLMGHLARRQTLPYVTYFKIINAIHVSDDRWQSAIMAVFPGANIAVPLRLVTKKIAYINTAYVVCK